MMKQEDNNNGNIHHGGSVNDITSSTAATATAPSASSFSSSFFSSSTRRRLQQQQQQSPPIQEEVNNDSITKNESWNLCYQQRWMSLQMRLGLVPQEACVLSQDTHRSLLHEACRHGNLLFSGMDSGRISALIIKSIYYAYPDALLIKDGVTGRTPLHYALACGDDEETVPAQQPPSLDIICTLLDLGQGGNDVDADDLLFDYDGPSSPDSDQEQGVGLIQDHLGDTPLHTACRYNRRDTSSKQILRELLDSCPSAILKVDKEGMSPLRRLWTRLEEEYHQKEPIHFFQFFDQDPSQTTSREMSLYDIISNHIHLYQDLTKFPNILDTWNKLVWFYQFLNTWEVPEEEEEEAPSTGSSPELSFQILHSIAASDASGTCMTLALKLYPEEFLELDDYGQTILDIAISQPAVGSSSSTNKQGPTLEEEKDPLLSASTSSSPCVIDVLLEHDAKKSKNSTSKSLYELCTQNCCHTKPPLHRAILAGKHWRDGLKALCQVDDDRVKEQDSTTQLYPFMMAAAAVGSAPSTTNVAAAAAAAAPISSTVTSPINDVNQVETIYELLKRAPELVLPQESTTTTTTFKKESTAALKRKVSSLDDHISSLDERTKKLKKIGFL